MRLQCTVNLIQEKWRTPSIFITYLPLNLSVG
jgi:hypothetical protein